MESRKSFRILKFKKSKPVLKISGISKSYGHRLVLKKINFELHKSEIFGVLGPNGCGKTTIFNSIMGICRINEGNIFVNNIKINNLPIHERATKFRIGYIPQNSAVFLGLTCEENIRAIAEVKIKEKSLQENKIQELLSDFNLEYLKNIKAINLSGGEKKRLCISMALVSNPQILLMDEPFAALDLITIDMIKKIIVSLQKKLISVIVTDHNAKDLMNVSDRCIIISNGEVIISGNPRKIINDPKARQLYFGENFSI
jgi:lipopolysaccharide export system ATP-binding protein|tara:strand:+ start:368 stop:1138 length:771 start_codon:yes stop_codon:yes gene_type:complete